EMDNPKQGGLNVEDVSIVINDSIVINTIHISFFFLIGGRLFAVLIDETRDASIKEQMVVVVRYVTSFTLHFVTHIKKGLILII
ncbi:hypothetical protein ACJX0J_035085, partial [Zea mays]